jgi:HD superfamily phosphohydrolase
VQRTPKLSAMVQLIHSELDADGIDYVMRDATFSGTSYGGFELGLLLRNLVVKKYYGVDIVGVRPKGISVVDQFLISKYFSYTQVIFNRHVAIFDKMAEMLTTALINLDGSPYPHAKTLQTHIIQHDHNDSYLRFTDRAFWSQIDTMQESDFHGYAPDCIVATHKKLSHYQEFSSNSNEEIVITSNDKKKVYNTLSKSAIYSRLLNTDEKHLMLFHTREFTSEVSEQRFRETLSLTTKNKDDTVSEDRFIEKNKPRLQEGMPVIEHDKPLKLLVDDSRSIMSHFAGTKTYILREYSIE